MNNSEVFDNFIKIATEKGLVSKSEHAEHTEQNTKSPRWDSLDISAIEALYGVKPDLPKGMEYEHNIMEDAHPNSIVIAPSYDKLNGLVENNNEQQNILMHILFKEPEMGSPNQAKYPLKPNMIYPNILSEKKANKDLLLSLVRVANDMDNKDKEELRILADTCLTQFHSQGFKKQAIIPWLIAAAVILGVTYMKEHLNDVDLGIKENYARLQNELQDFLKADITLGFGHKYDNFLKQIVSQAQSQLNEFWSVYTDASKLLLLLEQSHNAKDLVQQAQQPDAQKFVQAYNDLTNATLKLYPILEKLDQEFNNSDFKSEHTSDKGTFTSLLDQVPFLHGGKSLTADDFDDVVNAIPPFKDSVQRLSAILKEAGNRKDAVLKDTSSAIESTNVTAPVTTEKAPEQQTVKNIDEKAAEEYNKYQQLLGPETPDFMG